MNTSVKLWKAGIVRPIEAQNWLAKGQSRNRCCSVSIAFWSQSTQSWDCRTIHFLLNKSLLLSLSFRSNQTKTLCLCWQQFFQSHLKGGGDCGKTCQVFVSFGAREKGRAPNVVPWIMIGGTMEAIPFFYRGAEVVSMLLRIGVSEKLIKGSGRQSSFY